MTLTMENCQSRDSISTFGLNSQKSNAVASLFKKTQAICSNRGNHLKFSLCLLLVSDNNKFFAFFLPESFCLSS